MRILFLSPTLGTGGAERLTIAYAKGLARRGHEVHVAYGFADSQLPNLTAADIGATLLSNRRIKPRTIRQWIGNLRRLVAAFRPDVIYAQSITSALAARLGASQVPLLVTVHGIREADEPLASGILRLSRARVTAVSQAVADGLLRHAYAPAIEVLPPGIDIETLEAGAGEELEHRVDGTPRFCCVARLSQEKGVDVLLRAFREVLRDSPEALLTLVGVGPELEAIEALAKTLGVTDRVVFAGLTANPGPYFRDADVVVLPSRREGLPLVGLEAFALGRPVVATSVGGTTEVVRDGETGWLVPPENHQELARAMAEAAGDPEEAGRRARAGEELVRSSFTSARMVDRIEALALEVLQQPSLTPGTRSRLYYRAGNGVEAVRLAAARTRSVRREPSWQGVRIFGYHRVTDEDDVFAVGVQAFREQMELLAASDVRLLRLDAALDLLDRPVEGRYACVTFDDGYLDNLEVALPILRELEIPATIFVPTGLIDSARGFHWYSEPPPALSWKDVEEIAADGFFDVQAHSRSHARLPVLSNEGAWDEIAGSKRDLEERLPYTLTSFCYPAGLYSEREMEMVLTAGFRAGVTTRPGVNGGGNGQAALRRTMVRWRDGRSEFEGKLRGFLDGPSRLQAVVHRSRMRRSRDDVRAARASGR
jgi:glycosyltransferase involved in cell wall biosynthesis/peptidoglycan/xylan/chitin deacetylase (PgdA/CDA1 family)